jgi:hypothetical protein
MSFQSKVVHFDRARERHFDRLKSSGRTAAGRPLPHSLEAEEHLLSCCLLDGGEVVARCIDAGIRPESFYDAKHGVIFERLLDMFQRRVPIDVSVIAEELKKSKQLDQVGGYAFLTQVSSRIPTIAQAGYFIETCKRLALARARIRSGTGLIESVFTGDDDAVKRMNAELRELESEESAFLPAVVSAVKLAEKKLVRPAELVAGVLLLRCLMIIAGGSKSFKTWVLLDLAIAIASGTPWWGLTTVKGKVLFVNFELDEWALDERIGEICKARNIARPENLEVWNLRGYATDIDELLPYFEARGIRGQYSLIILDPIYVCLGARDENSNSDVTQLMNRLMKLTRVTGAAVAFGHHFSKGNQSEKDARDRASGAGAWVRAPDTVVTLTAHEEESAFRVDYVLRNLKQKKEHVVRWEHPCMRLAAELNPAALKGPGRTKEYGIGDFCDLLEDGSLTYGELMKKAGVGKTGKMSESTFKRLRTEAIEAKRVMQNGPLYQLAGRENK